MCCNSDQIRVIAIASGWVLLIPLLSAGYELHLLLFVAACVIYKNWSRIENHVLTRLNYCALYLHMFMCFCKRFRYLAGCLCIFVFGAFVVHVVVLVIFVVFLFWMLFLLVVVSDDDVVDDAATKI